MMFPTRRRQSTLHIRTLVTIVSLVLAAFPAAALGSGESGAAQAESTRRLVDALGRTVTVPADPQRIVTAGRAVLMAADALYLFESASQRLVGIGRIDQGYGNFLPQIDPGYEEKVVIQPNVGPEQLVALRPDVVILKSFLKADLGDAVERLGVPVLYVDLETPDQFYRDVRMLGALVNEPARAEEIVAYYQRRVAEITGAVAPASGSGAGAPTAGPATGASGSSASANGGRPRVLLIQHTGGGSGVSFAIPPEGWLQTQLVTMGGGLPVWAEEHRQGGWRTITLEQIAAWDPDHIILVAYRDDSAAVRDRLAGEAVWRDLNAVKNGRFHAMPADFYSWDQPDTRWILGLTWIASRLRPTLPAVGPQSTTEALYEFFNFAYRMDATAVDAVIKPMLRGELD